MALLTKPSSAARTAVIYITTGALIEVWTWIWYFYLRNFPAEEVRLSIWYICYGLQLTGLVLLIIGLLIGHIGRSARNAELPPPEVTPTQAQLDQEAVAHGANPNVAGLGTVYTVAPPPAPAAVPMQGVTAVPISPPVAAISAAPAAPAAKR